MKVLYEKYIFKIQYMMQYKQRLTKTLIEYIVEFYFYY